ncbi:MAG: hypothetical protein MOGMAGMI_00951 [Candidatus Omnitrophica bacterium]|nr:hypothetical protein [Candidatus Omnitrophota bacterium]
MTRASSGRKDSALSAITWWVGWIAVTIVSFFVSCWFWTGHLARHYGTMDKPGAPLVWVVAVFGTWMILLVPLIVIMYAKVDKAYEDARIGREGDAYEKVRRAMGVRCLDIPQRSRVLAEPLRRKLKQWPETVRKGHLVHLILRDGRRVEHAFVLERREVLGVYDLSDRTFDPSAITDIEPIPQDRIPDFNSARWVRLDGVGLPFEDEKPAV